MKYEKLGSSLVFAISDNPHQHFLVEIHLKDRTLQGSYSIDQIDEISEKDEVLGIQLIKTTAAETCQCMCGCASEEILDTAKCWFCSIYMYDEISLEHSV